jgi:hypothetical protein
MVTVAGDCDKPPGFGAGGCVRLALGAGVELPAKTRRTPIGISHKRLCRQNGSWLEGNSVTIWEVVMGTREGGKAVRDFVSAGMQSCGCSFGLFPEAYQALGFLEQIKLRSLDQTR